MGLLSQSVGEWMKICLVESLSEFESFSKPIYEVLEEIRKVRKLLKLKLNISRITVFIFGLKNECNEYSLKKLTLIRAML